MGDIIRIGRGRPPGELALSMDATALVLDDLSWDERELALEDAVYRLLVGIACDGDADERSRRRASRGLQLMRANIAQDARENSRNSRQVGHLRVLNGRLEGQTKPAAVTAGGPDAA